MATKKQPDKGTPPKNPKDNYAYKAHPLADLFPLIEGEELKGLADDIKANGLLHPIVLFKGKVLDGRNRLRACKLAGVEPDFEDYSGSKDEASAYVVSANLNRRHLTTAQRAALAVRLLPQEKTLARKRMLTGQAKIDPTQKFAEGGAKKKGEATALAGAQVGVSKEIVRQAQRLSEAAPDVFKAMASGVIKSMPDAQRLASFPKKSRKKAIDVVQSQGSTVKKAISAVTATTGGRKPAKASKAGKRNAMLSQFKLLADKATSDEGGLWFFQEVIGQARNRFQNVANALPGGTRVLFLSGPYAGKKGLTSGGYKASKNGYVVTVRNPDGTRAKNAKGNAALTRVSLKTLGTDWKII